MLMDDRAFRSPATRRAFAGLVAVLACWTGGCSPYLGTTARSFLSHVRQNPDPNIRYIAYSKLGGRDVFDDEGQKREAVETLIDKYENGGEPVASRAIICRTLGEIGDPKAREVLLKAVHHQEAVIKVEACRALGKVGLPEDATVLAQIMTLDMLEDARIAAIEGLADLESHDPRIYKVLVDAMEHDDPAIRLASLNTLRTLTKKDLGTEVEAWRRELAPVLERAAMGSTVSGEAVAASEDDEPATTEAEGEAEARKTRSLFSRRP